MAVKLRLKRFGRKKRPVYRLVAAESAKPRDGKTLEELGVYDPCTDPIKLDLKEDRIKHWISVGAQPSKPVERLLGKAGLVEAPKRESQQKGISKKDRSGDSAE